MTIINNDCLLALREYSNNYFTSIITDPPYGLSFMGKKWDYDVPSVEIWQECLRVLKPGGTLLCFAGSRTQHRMAVNVEDAGFIIKDTLMWLYGSGFPKATDIGKQLDKGHERKVVGEKRSGSSSRAYQSLETTTKGIHYETAPSTPEAKQFDGYKSHGLKPAYEPIIMAMKPNEGSYAENALKYGVSGINIDAGRIGTKPRTTHKDGNYKGGGNDLYESGLKESYYSEGAKGRFPANIILDEEVGKDERWKRFFYCAKASKAERNAGCEGLEEKTVEHDFGSGDIAISRSQRIHPKMNNHHPTVKPLKLMEYLIKLIMPPKDGLILDPFAGSGTTLVAAKKLGFNAVGIERESEYCQIIAKRIENIQAEVFDKQLKLDI